VEGGDVLIAMSENGGLYQVTRVFDGATGDVPVECCAKIPK